MTGGGEVHMEGARCTWRGRGAHGGAGLGYMTGGGEVHVEGARVLGYMHEWRRRGARGGG